MTFTLINSPVCFLIKACEIIGLMRVCDKWRVACGGALTAAPLSLPQDHTQLMIYDHGYSSFLLLSHQLDCCLCIRAAFPSGKVLADLHSHQDFYGEQEGCSIVFKFEGFIIFQWHFLWASFNLREPNLQQPKHIQPFSNFKEFLHCHTISFNKCIVMFYVYVKHNINISIC